MCIRDRCPTLLLCPHPTINSAVDRLATGDTGIVDRVKYLASDTWYTTRKTRVTYSYLKDRSILIPEFDFVEVAHGTFRTTVV